jgi:hypothetical protein
LSITEGRDGRALVHCFAGCATTAILDALQLRWWDLFAEASPAPSASVAVSTYDQVCAGLLANDQHHAARRRRWAHIVELTDEARAIDRLIHETRRIVTQLEDCPDAWELAERATELELLMLSAEAEAHQAIAGCALW